MVKVFLVALGDNGKTGKKIGCEDSLVAVTRSVKSIAAPLKSALEELLTIPRDYDETLSNFWGGNNLKIKSVSLRSGLATIRLTGDGPVITGICDEPRITSQIEETAKQFPTVKRVQIFVNNQRLEQVMK
jgi:spore germination protein GerM